MIGQGLGLRGTWSMNREAGLRWSVSRPRGDGDEADAVGFERLDVVEAIDQGPAEPVELPNQHAVELALAGVRHEAVEAGPAGLGPADDVGVGDDDLPALAADVALELLRLEGGVLVGAREAGVGTDPHLAPPSEDHRWSDRPDGVRPAWVKFGSVFALLSPLRRWSEPTVTFVSD
jgi:hypothetical protein